MNHCARYVDQWPFSSKVIIIIIPDVSLWNAMKILRSVLFYVKFS